MTFTKNNLFNNNEQIQKAFNAKPKMIKKEKHMHTIYLKESRNMHRRYELIVKMCLFNSQFIPLYQIKRKKTHTVFFTEKKMFIYPFDNKWYSIHG